MECPLCGKGSKTSPIDFIYNVKEMVQQHEEQRLDILEELKAVDYVETENEKQARADLYAKMKEKIPVLKEAVHVADETDWSD